MEIKVKLNGKFVSGNIAPDMLLIDFLRDQTLEGLQDEAAEFAGFIADQGADQCGFCNPGFVMNTIALLRENPDPSDDEIRAYLAGNLCRCSGYEGQLRGIRNYLDSRIPADDRQ